MLPPQTRHVFLEQLRGVPVDLERFTGAFDVLTTERLQQYREALPEEWVGDGQVLNAMLDYVRALRQNITASVANLRGALQ